MKKGIRVFSERAVLQNVEGIRRDRPVVTPSVPLTGAPVSVGVSDPTQVGSSSI